MANYYKTLNYNFETPQPSEDLDIPGDMKLLADQVDTTLAQVINNNLITDVVLTTNGPTNTADIVNGTLSLNIVPQIDVSTKYDKTGGTISGNVTVTGTMTVGQLGTFNSGVLVPSPSLGGHATNKTYVDSKVSGSTPIGTVVMYAGASAPAGWLLCNGAAIPSQYTTLIALVGANTPDLRNRFVVGAGSTYAVRSTTGASSVTLTTANLPSHTHTINSTSVNHDHSVATSSSALGDHKHSGTVNSGGASHTHTGSTNSTGSHAHGTGYFGNFMIQGSDSANNNIWYMTQTSDTLYTTTPSDGSHAHSFTTGATTALHSHSISLNDTNLAHTHTVDVMSATTTHSHTATNTGSGTAFNITPLSYALTYIIFAGA